MRMTPWLSGVTALMFALTTLAVAGIVHIVTVLALPYRAADDAFARVAAMTRPNTKVVLRPDAANDPRLPFRDPTMAMAFCRYDLRAGPLRLALAPFPEGFLSIGFHSRHGQAFYGLSIRSADATDLAVVLATAEQKQAVDAQASGSDAPARDIVVTPPEAEGFIAIQAPIQDAGEAFAAVGCTAETAARS